MAQRTWLTLLALQFSAIILFAQPVRYPDSTLVDGRERVFVFRELSMTILSIHGGFDFLFTPKNVSPVSAVARRGKYRFMINASFFDNERLNAGHAGWLRILGKTYAPLRHDNQLTHILRYDTTSGKVSIVSWQNFLPHNDNHSIEFQTGPLIVDNDSVAHALIAGSVNGLGKYTRTLLAVCDEREMFFITVRKPIALDELARYLLSLSIFQKRRLEVLNLDGGPSVAFFSRAFSRLNYNVNDRLPLLLGVR